jgi:hypothetical protein
MYEAHGFTAPGAHFGEVKEYRYADIDVARKLGRLEAAVRLEERLEHIRAVYLSQMS